MKKSLMFVMLGIISFLGINSVSAYTSEAEPLTGTYNASNYYLYFDKHIEGYETYKDNINHLIDYWENNHSSEYPFYFIIADYGSRLNSDDLYYRYTLYSSNSTEFLLETGTLVGVGSSFDGNQYVASYSYTSDTNEYKYSGIMEFFQFPLKGSSYIIDSNISPTFKQQEFKYTQNSVLHTEDFDTIHLPSFSSEITSLSIPEIEIKDKGKIPTLKSLYDGSYVSDLTSNYKEINLNNYSYIALSLKDYNNVPDNNYSKYTNIYVKGQLCITPVYNYGMTERKDILTDSQMQGCSVYYDDFSLNRMYILKEDVKNHAIYYLKAYDTSKENVVKIDTSMFDISYITEDDKDNPSVSIGGKNYPTLSYDTLTDSATISQNNGYTPGISCAVGDMNCYKDNNTDNIFDDLFSNPLEFFKDVFSSVKSIFDIVVEFIALLPPMMQSFLYLSFMLAIILGLIKIIL